MCVFLHERPDPLHKWNNQFVLVHALVACAPKGVLKIDVRTEGVRISQVENW
jgi:hypothetical protein